MPKQLPEESEPLMAVKDIHDEPSVATDETADGAKRIKLKGKKSVVIFETELVIEDAAASRSICFPSKPTSIRIPFYNVIWAESQGITLIIDYAQRQKHNVVMHQLNSVTTNATAEQLSDLTSDLMNRVYATVQRQKRALVLVNPASGPGRAVKLWSTQSKPIFDAARMPMDVIITTHGGQASDICEKMDINNYDIVVGCAGDGMPFEIFNGLGKRVDAARALSKIAVAHIPCGSGNGMSYNLYGTHRPSLAALAIVKGVTTLLDLVSVTQGETRILSFMSQNVGIIAECDLATEHLRWMGDNRFVMGFLQRVMSGMAYPCDIAVKVELEQPNDIKAHYHKEQSQTDLNVRAAQEASVPSSTEGLPALKYGTSTDALPKDWDVINADKLGCLYVGNMAYMDKTNNFFSAACTNDGLLDMITVDADIGTLNWIRLMDAVEKGTLLDNQFVTYKKVSAFRVTPRNQADGYISIDGEKIPFGPFQCEVHQGLGRVISKNGTFEGPGPGEWDSVTLTQRMHA